METIELKYNIGSVVQTPLYVGLIMEAKFNAGGHWYLVLNAISNVDDYWWHERFLSDPPPEEEA